MKLSDDLALRIARRRTPAIVADIEANTGTLSETASERLAEAVTEGLADLLGDLRIEEGGEAR